MSLALLREMDAGLRRPGPPEPPELVAAYLLELAKKREGSVVTSRLHKAALAAMHRANGHADPTDHEGVRRQAVPGM